MAQPAASEVKIRALVVLGKGIAASTDNPMDFLIAKLGIGKVIYNLTGTQENKTIGILKLDDELYRLRDVVVEEGHAAGKIYKNSSEVGSFDISSVMKGDTEVWTGTLSMNKTYNMYLIEGARPTRASELKERVVEYCNKTEDDNCRERLGRYCEDYPDDSRCKAIFRAYCLKADNMDDTRCRQEFSEWCQKNPANQYCIPFVLNRSKTYCEQYSDSTLCRKIANTAADLCVNNTSNEGCAKLKQIIQTTPKLLQKIQSIRNRISNLRINVSSIHGVATSSDVGG